MREIGAFLRSGAGRQERLYAGRDVSAARGVQIFGLIHPAASSYSWMRPPRRSRRCSAPAEGGATACGVERLTVSAVWDAHRTVEAHELLGRSRRHAGDLGGGFWGPPVYFALFATTASPSECSRGLDLSFRQISHGRPAFGWLAALGSNNLHIGSMSVSI
jgi:hypothetical protein